MLVSFVLQIWALWEKGEATEIIDTLMDGETYEENDVIKCVHIGLLCVQESPFDRPDMSSVVFMFGHNAINLPSPKHPAFMVGRKINVQNSGSSGTLPSGETGGSFNDVTLTDVQGRQKTTKCFFPFSMNNNTSLSIGFTINGSTK